jgi:lysine biosynthesis protein LysW
MVPTATCPNCQITLEIEGYEETEVFKCPKCGMMLEVVSVYPPILEESLEEPLDDDE